MAKLDLTNTNENAIATNEGTSSMMTGDWGTEDLSIPRLSLVQATSSLDEFDKGSFVYDKQVQVNRRDEEFDAYVLQMHKYYEEDLEFGSGERPKRYASAEEALAEGRVPKFSNQSGVEFSERCDMVLLVPVPLEFAHYEVAGQGFVKAMYTFKSTSYNIAKRVFTATNSKNAGGITYALRWKMSSELKTNGSNKWYVPSLVNQGKADAEVAEYIANEVA